MLLTCYDCPSQLVVENNRKLKLTAIDVGRIAGWVLRDLGDQVVWRCPECALHHDAVKGEK